MTSGSAAPEAIKNVDAGSIELAAVIDLSKCHQNTLGQLPYEAFQKFAADGHVLASWSGSDLAGYAMYRVRKRTGVAVLVHLCVADGHRGEGHADRLIDDICSRHPFAPGLAAWCREDYPAHNRWPSLGFDRTSTRLGRGRDRKRLVHWWRPINEMTLFTFDASQESVPAAAIDTNVFRDIVEPRSGFPESIALGEPWLIDSVELVITGQLQTEIEEASRTTASLTGTTARFRWLSPPAGEWRPIFKDLAAALAQTAVEPGDIRQLAQACAGEARYFATRDEGILANRDTIEAITGVEVMRPLDLALAMHADQFEISYEAAALRESALEIRHPSRVPDVSVLHHFTDHARKEKSGDVQRELKDVAPGLAGGARLWELAPPNAMPVVVAATSMDDSAVIVHCLRVRSDRHRVTFARQMLHLFREEAVNERRGRVRFTGTVPDYLERALIAEGYTTADAGWVARCETGQLRDRDEVPEGSRSATAADLQPEEVSQLERVLWPLKIVGGNVPTYIVPIRPAWARALFGKEPQQAELFPRPANLSLAREHVYYRSFTRTIEAPARLLWWVSGGGANGGMRATSWLEAAVAGRPRTLYRRFGAQGIYEQRNVESLVKHKGGEALALVFSRTETFLTNVPLDVAREIHPAMGQNGYLQTTKRVDEHVFATFYAIGTAPR